MSRSAVRAGKPRKLSRRRSAAARTTGRRYSVRPGFGRYSAGGPQPLRGYLGPAIDEKYFDNTTYMATPLSFIQTGSVVHLDIVPQGDAVTMRDGKSWIETSVQFNLTVALGTTATITSGVFMLVWDFQPNAAASVPLLATIINTVTPADLSFPNRDYQSRFKIIYAKKFEGVGGKDGGGIFVDGSAIQCVSENVRFPFKAVAETTAGDTTGAISARIRGSLLAVTYGSGTSAAVGGDAFRGLLNVRINFVDV